MQTINENSTCFVPASFYDKNGSAEVPASISYRIDDVASGTEIKADTSVGAASSIEITVAATENAILDGDNKYEVKRLTLTATYGASERATEVVYWRVRNLEAVS